MLWALTLSASLFSLSGCSNTVRYMTPMKWLNASGGPGGAAPAAGAVKFDDDVRAFFHLDVVHAVFQRIERVEAARATPAQFLGGVENDLWKNLQEVV